MRANGWFFGVVAGFFAVVDVIYWYTSHDPTGTTALAFSFGLAFLISYYLFFTQRRLPLQPEDDTEAEVEDGAGELGFFSPHSIWPFWMGLGAGITMLGLVFGWWLFFMGAGVFGAAALGLVFEYYVSSAHGGAPPSHFHSSQP